MRQKGFIPVVILLAFIGLVLIVHFSFFYKSSSQQPAQLPSQPSPTTEPSAGPDVTANWKAFSQKDILPISFKYPGNLVVSTRGGERPVIVIDTKQNSIPEMFDSPIAPIEIMLDLNGNTYEKAVENAKEGFEPASLKTEILSGNGIVGSLISGNVIPGMRNGRFVEAYFDNGASPAIMFWYEGYSETYKGTTVTEETFIQILKTVSSVE